MQEKIFSVSEFNEFIDIILRQIGEVMVEGEISQLTKRNQYIFITIKDEQSSLELFTLSHLTNFYQLEEGMLIKVTGVPTLYKKVGKFSLFATQITPSGEGSLKIAYERLKKRLEEEGLFNPERKRPLPPLPEKIGLITAPDSQAFKDFKKILSERTRGITIYFFPAVVQGVEAVPSILKAFNYFNKTKTKLDAIVLIRGGGSLEDLSAFNTEEIARAVFSSRFPVVCGVGHEGDVTLADLVADLRASTPSNAAELIARSRQEIIESINNKINLMYTVLQSSINQNKHKIYQTIDILRLSIDNQFNRINNQILNFGYQINKKEEQIKAIKQKTYLLKKIINNLDYKKMLKRGYSITKTDGKIIKSIKQVSSQQRLETILSDGVIKSQIT